MMQLPCVQVDERMRNPIVLPNLFYIHFSHLWNASTVATDVLVKQCMDIIYISSLPIR